MSIREGWSKKLDEVRWPFDPPKNEIQRQLNHRATVDIQRAAEEVLLNVYRAAGVDVDHETPE
jgi:hypothetical protein